MKIAVKRTMSFIVGQGGPGQGGPGQGGQGQGGQGKGGQGQGGFSSSISRTFLAQFGLVKDASLPFTVTIIIAITFTTTVTVIIVVTVIVIILVTVTVIAIIIVIVDVFAGNQSHRGQTGSAGTNYVMHLYHDCEDGVKYKMGTNMNDYADQITK